MEHAGNSKKMVFPILPISSGKPVGINNKDGIPHGPIFVWP